MIWDSLGKLFGNRNERMLKKLEPIVEEVNQLEQKMRSMTDSQLKVFPDELKERLGKDKDIDAAMEKILPEAFALVREVSCRTLKMRHFDVQILGGIVLHRGIIAEMKTGEGKTLAATLPVFLNAIARKKVHLVTVNDYLAKRDAEWMSPIYEFLGLTVGVLQNMMEYDERQAAYRCHVVYGTNSEFGFDYLRDNMVLSKEHTVQGDLDFAIIDEVDSILIDEARTPLIISGASVESTKKYVTIDKFVRRLKQDDHFELHEKEKTAVLMDEGVEHMEALLGVNNLYEPQNFHLVHYITKSLCAHNCYKRDIDYIVKDNQVLIVDEFTGRIMDGRRFSDGLHQALEAKEKVSVKEESQTLATITIQNYFRMYHKLAGMTGTALTEAGEFIEIYKLDVLVIPTNELMIRSDYNDAVYKTKQGKVLAIIEEIAKWHKAGRPILVGTTSIEDSETLSALLRRNKNIQCNVLNAKHHQREAEIISRAGEAGAITIATNMAGRGTDIKLGEGTVLCPRVEGRMHCWVSPPEQGWTKCLPEHKACAKEAGCGLYIIGSERHESRRIDNQLRGRSGRQGDPGASRFFISLEDDLMRLFGSDKMRGMLDKLGLPEDERIEHPIISSGIERAQKQVEAHNFDIRKNLLKYDDVNNEQRKLVYRLRKKILKMEGIEEEAREMMTSSVRENMNGFFPPKVLPDMWDIKGAVQYLNQLHLTIHRELEGSLDAMEPDKIIDNAVSDTEKVFDRKKAMLAEEFPYFLKAIILEILDFNWKDHLLSMDGLREVIYYRAYGQKDPLIEYKKESFELFEDMLAQVEDGVTSVFFRLAENEELTAFLHVKKQEEFYQGHKKDASLLMTGKSQDTSKVKQKMEDITSRHGFGKRRKKK